VWGIYLCGGAEAIVVLLCMCITTHCVKSLLVVAAGLGVYMFGDIPVWKCGVLSVDYMFLSFIT
jgi:hypothetical protein